MINMSLYRSIYLYNIDIVSTLYDSITYTFK